MADISVKLGGDNSAFRGMLDDSVSAVGRFGSALGALGPALSVAGVATFFRTVANEASAMQDLSERLGVSTDSLQAFSFAVREAGGTNEQAILTWDKARKALDMLAAGVPETVKQFEKLGLSAKDFLGLDLAQSLEAIALGYRNNADQAGAYDAITDILGSKTLPKVMEAINRLANEGFPALTEAGKKMGQVAAPEWIENIDSFTDSLGRLWQMTKNVGAGMLSFMIEMGKLPGVIAASEFGFNTDPRELRKELKNEAARGKKDTAQKIPDVTDSQRLAMAKLELELDKELREQKEKDRKEDEKAAKEKEAFLTSIQKTRLENAQAELDANYKLISQARERAKAEGAVTSEMQGQLAAIQKMAGAGSGGFKAGSGGGGEAKVSVSTLRDVLANAKNAFESLRKNPNAPDYARDYIQAEALVNQSEKNLRTGENQQGMGTPIEVAISGLDFTPLAKFSDAALGSKEQVSLDKEMLALTRSTEMSTKEINRVLTNIEKQIAK